MSEAQDPARRDPEEGPAWRVLRVLGGALLRVGRAAPDYLSRSRPALPEPAVDADEDPADEDTGEWPAPDTTPEA